MSEQPYVFRPSPWLGERANLVFTAFVCALEMPGDIAECGVYQGHTSHEFVRFLEEREINKTVHMFDSFTGFPDTLLLEEEDLSRPGSDWADLSPGAMGCPVGAVRHFMQDFSRSRYEIHKGFFCDTLPKFDEPLCFIHADADIYTSTVEIIQFADRVLIPGGLMIMDDYNHPRFPGVKAAVYQYLDSARYEMYPSTDFKQAFIIKRGGDPALRPEISLTIIGEDE